MSKWRLRGGKSCLSYLTSENKSNMTCWTHWMSSSIQQFQIFFMTQNSRGNFHPETTDTRSHKALPADPAIPVHWNAPPWLPTSGVQLCQTREQSSLLADPFKLGLMPEPAFKLTFSFCYNYTITLSKTSTSVAVKSQTSKDILRKQSGTSSYPYYYDLQQLPTNPQKESSCLRLGGERSHSRD